MTNENLGSHAGGRRRDHARFTATVAQFVAVLSVIAFATPALAHDGAALTDATAWSAWDLTPDIVLPTLLVAWIYIRGMIRRRDAAAATPWWRHVL